MNNEYKGMVEDLKKSLARAKANRSHDYYVDNSETAINALEKAITMLQMINMKIDDSKHQSDFNKVLGPR